MAVIGKQKQTWFQAVRIVAPVSSNLLQGNGFQPVIAKRVHGLFLWLASPGYIAERDRDRNEKALREGRASNWCRNISIPPAPVQTAYSFEAMPTPKSVNTTMLSTLQLTSLIFRRLRSWDEK